MIKVIKERKESQFTIKQYKEQRRRVKRMNISDSDIFRITKNPNIYKCRYGKDV